VDGDTQEGWARRARGRTIVPMNGIHAELARQTIDSRIAEAERARAVRSLTRPTGVAPGRTRRVLQPIAHPGLALARLWRPE
jgi:hypothetical protein